MNLESFISENFLAPLCRYYTLAGTLTYGIILIIGVIGTYRLLKFLRIKIDKRFFLGVLPFIIYGGWTRALRDYKLGIYQSGIFCSPPIYFFVFSIALISLIIGISIERRLKRYSKAFGFEKMMWIIALPLLFYNLTLTSISNFSGFFIILSLVGLWSLIFFGINRIKPRILTNENAFILVSHLLDASSTFTAMTFFGFYEQHVLPTFLISVLGSWVMFPLKIAVVWPVLYYIDKSKEDVLFKEFLKIIILILGLALGIRDFISVSIL